MAMERNTRRQLASPGLILGASALDWLIFWIVPAGATVIIFSMSWARSGGVVGNWDWLVWELVVCAVWLVVSPALQFLSLANHGATLGQRIRGLEMAADEGVRPGLGRLVFVRSLGWGIPLVVASGLGAGMANLEADETTMVFVVSGIWVALLLLNYGWVFTTERRTLADRLARTSVRLRARSGSNE
jgi:hypothetical protein